MIKRSFILLCLIWIQLSGAVKGRIWSACKPGETGLHIDKTLYGKILESRSFYHASFFCDGWIPHSTTNKGNNLLDYMRGVVLYKYPDKKNGMRWQTGPTHLSDYTPLLDSLWPVDQKGDLISNYIQIGGVVAFLYFLEIKDHAIIVIKKWYAPYAKIWENHGQLNVAIAHMYGMIPKIYIYKNNKFMLTPNQKHPWYFIHEARKYYYLMHGKRSPTSLAIACNQAIHYSNVAKDYRLGKDACLFAKNKILQRRNLHIGEGKHGQPTPADIISSLKEIDKQLKNIHKQHDFM